MSAPRGLSKPQKMLLHIYKDAANLDEQKYRQILRDKAGVGSAADRRFGQCQFDVVMAELERVLFERVSSALVAAPTSHYIKDEFHWRGKCPAQGHSNVRQRHAIEEVWSLLAERLPPACATQHYLLGLIRQAAGRPAMPHQLTRREADLVIDALKGRLSTALKLSAA